MFINIYSPFWHPGKGFAWVWRDPLVEWSHHSWRWTIELPVLDVRIAPSNIEQQIMFTIKFNVRYTSSILDITFCHWLIKIFEVPYSKLSVSTRAKSWCNKSCIVDPWNFLRSWTLMRSCHHDWALNSWVKECHLVFLDHAAKQISDWTPTHGCTNFIYTSEADLLFSLVAVPNSYSVVFCVWSQHVFYDWVPLERLAFLHVIIKAHRIFGGVLGKAFLVFYDPKFDIWVVRRGCEEFVLEGAPLQVSDWALMTLE